MISLLKQVGQYLRLRRMLGFKLRHEGFMLPGFVRFITKHGGKITSKLALKWATIDPDASFGWWNHRLTMVREFAKFVHARNPQHEIPPRNLLTVPRHRRIKPYIFQRRDIVSLIKISRRRGGVYGETDATVLGLLAATGMRIGEVLGLDRDDIDWKNGILLIRSGKFGKSRQIPVHPSTLKALAHYQTVRDKLMPIVRSPAFFLSGAGTRIHHQNFHLRYLRLLRESGLGARNTYRPRIHDLRHTFIISTLAEWYRTGKDVQTKIASLSTYVGHVCPSNTYWYMTTTQDLLGQAVRRLDRSQGGCHD